MEAPIASAVMLPEPEAEEQELDTAQDAESPQGGQKRRQSLVSELERKRARLDSADQTSSRNSGETSSAAVPRRREGERVRRLFGAVLGALSQNPATPAQKKRTDIEKRQKARRELQEQESDQRKAERIAQRTAQRRREQERFEKESVSCLFSDADTWADTDSATDSTRKSPVYGPLPSDRSRAPSGTCGCTAYCGYAFSIHWC